jgi:hypothetical protein
MVGRSVQLMETSLAGVASKPVRRSIVIRSSALVTVSFMAASSLLLSQAVYERRHIMEDL